MNRAGAHVASDAISWPALGTTAVLCVAGAGVGPARSAAQQEIEAMDRAASRFRPDSELSIINRAGGRRVTISRLLHEALNVAIEAALTTGGAVDPTLGESLIELGYDRDFAELEALGADTPLRPPPLRASRRPAWRSIELADAPPSVQIPARVSLDLGATAKALAADRGARAAQLATGSGVLLALGGDIATSGPAPEGGWPIRVTDDHRDITHDGQLVTIDSGGLATSSLVTRRWRHAGRAQHHILDPSSGTPVDAHWRTASVAASSCVGANIAATAAIVLGDRAPDWLTGRGLAARLVAVDGRVHTLGGWPA